MDQTKMSSWSSAGSIVNSWNNKTQTTKSDVFVFFRCWFQHLELENHRFQTQITTKKNYRFYFIRGAIEFLNTTKDD